MIISRMQDLTASLRSIKAHGQSTGFHLSLFCDEAPIPSPRNISRPSDVASEPHCQPQPYNRVLADLVRRSSAGYREIPG